MGCDIRATSKGTFVLEVRSYDRSGVVLGQIRLDCLDAGEGIDYEVLEGQERDLTDEWWE